MRHRNYGCWILIVTLIALGTVAWSGVAVAQEEGAAAAPAVEEAPAAPAGPKTAAFAAKLDEWRKLLNSLRELKVEYATADEARRDAISKEYGQLIEKGEAMEDALVAGAIEALEESSDNDSAKAVLANVIDHARMYDNYEEVYRLAKFMQGIGAAEEANQLYGVAGLAALYTNHFDEAEKWLNAADANMPLDQQGDQTLTVEYFRSLMPGLREKWEKESKIREAEAAADDLPRVKLSTDAGDFVIELFENEAPNTVANFISLVEKGFYKDVPFHRVLPGFMAQGGDPTGTGGGGPGYCIKDEINNPNFRKHFRGSLSMAKTMLPDSGGSQFFLTFVPTDHLDGKHTVFGRLIEGTENMSDIRRVDPQDPTAPAPTKIRDAKVLRKRDHEYKPETLPER